MAGLIADQRAACVARGVGPTPREGMVGGGFAGWRGASVQITTARRWGSHRNGPNGSALPALASRAKRSDGLHLHRIMGFACRACVPGYYG